MNKIKSLKIKKLLNFPIFIFAGFVIVVIISVFGSRWIRGQNLDLPEVSSSLCNKTGVNFAIPMTSVGQNELQKAKSVGMKWGLAIVYNNDQERNFITSQPGYENEAHPVARATAEKINLAKTYDINLILRICDIPNACGFAPSQAGREDPNAWYQSGIEYGNFLKEVGDRASTPVFAIGGHNEPHGDIQAGGGTAYPGVDKILAEYEASFIRGILSTGAQNEVNLLSPQLDLHNQETRYQEFVEAMGDDIFDQYYGIAVATHGTVPGTGEPGGRPPEKVELATQFPPFQGKPIFVTEIGAIDGEFNYLQENYQSILKNSNVEAELLFNAFFLNPQFDYHAPLADPQKVQQIIGDCGKYSSEESTVVDCAFEDNKLSPCEEEVVGMGRGLLMKFNDDFEFPNWKAEWIGTAQIMDLPAFAYFANTDYEGEGATDFPSQGVNLTRLSPGCVWDDQTQEELCYDPTGSYPGYGFLVAEGAIFGRPYYAKGSGVLLGVMGTYSDYTSPFRVPKQFLLKEQEIKEHKYAVKQDSLKAKSSSEGLLVSNDLTEIIQNHGIMQKMNKCQNTDFPIDAIWTQNSTSGYESEFGRGMYDMDLVELVKNSNIMLDIGCQCTVESGGANPCKIATDLGINGANCGGCYRSRLPCVCDATIPGDCEDKCDGYDPSFGGYYDDVYNCANIEVDNCGVNILNKDAMVQCLAGQEIYIRHSPQPMNFKLGGAGKILEQYWKKVQMLTPERPICHNKNIGIKTQVKGSLYDVEVDCRGGGGGAVCDNNLINNGDFEGGMRLPAQTEKQNWLKIPTYWYPFWSNQSNLTVKAPEYDQVGPGDSRAEDGSYAKIYTPQYVQAHDAGLFQEIHFGTVSGGTFATPRTTTMTVRALVQGNNGYMGESNPDQRVDERLEMQIGVRLGESIGDLANNNNPNDPSGVENFVLNNFESYASSGITTVKQQNNSSQYPGFDEISMNVTIPPGTSKVSIFLRGNHNCQNSNCPNKVQTFWDSVCVTLPEYPDVVNIFEEETPTVFPPGFGGGAPGFCMPDSRFNMKCSINTAIHESAISNSDMYFPYFGTVIHSINYLDNMQVAIEKGVPDLPDCEKASDDNILCYCEPDQVDPLAQYLIRIGELDRAEAKMGEVSASQHNEIQQQGDPGTQPDPEDIPNSYAPEIGGDAWEVFEAVEKAVEETSPDQCIPKEMLASIMSLETSTNNVTPNNLNQMFNVNNNSYCTKANTCCSDSDPSGCNGLTTPDFLDNNNDGIDDITDNRINQIVSNLRNNEPNCTGSLPSNNPSCAEAREVISDHVIVCCDVRGKMQFEIATWMGYKDNVEPVSKAVLQNFDPGYNLNAYVKPTRARLIDSIVAAALKLKTNCEYWENDEEQTVRSQAGCYSGGCNENSSYASSAWARYREYKYGPGTGKPPNPDDIVEPPSMGQDAEFRDSIPSVAIQFSVSAQCGGSSEICKAYPYNMVRTFSRLTPSVTDELYGADWRLVRNTGDYVSDFAGYITLPEGTIDTCDMFGDFLENEGFILTSDGISGHGVCNTMSFVNAAAGKFGLNNSVSKYATYGMPTYPSGSDLPTRYKASVTCPGYGTYIENDTGQELEIHWQFEGDIGSVWIER